VNEINRSKHVQPKTYLYPINSCSYLRRTASIALDLILVLWQNISIDLGKRSDIMQLTWHFSINSEVGSFYYTYISKDYRCKEAIIAIENANNFLAYITNGHKHLTAEYRFDKLSMAQAWAENKLEELCG
jgi:hypothetical protein